MNATRRFPAAARHALALLAALTLAGTARAAIPIQHWKLPSGAQVYLVESPTVPMVDVRIEFDAGNRRDPAAQAGLADAAAAMMGKGVRAAGTEPALDENALGEAWADLGASLEGGASADRAGFSLRSLTYPDLLARAVALAARQLAEPAFDAAVWARERERMDAGLREALTRPGTVAERAFRRAVFGSHPYGQLSDAQTLARIGAEDLRAWHARYVRACGATVSIVGALSRAQAEQLAQRLLARLPADGCTPPPSLPEVEPLRAAQEQQIAFDSAQAHVLIGQPGLRRDDPDYFALMVGNYILGGGGFVSRLMNEVREKRGLSYSVYSYFSPGLQAGPFMLGLQTRPDQAAEAVRVARDTLGRFVAQGPTEAEVQAAKRYLVGSFALRIDNNRKLIDNVANIAVHQLPLNYLDTWTREVQRVSVADIRAAFQRKLQPERMVTVVVGGQDGK